MRQQALRRAAGALARPGGEARAEFSARCREIGEALNLRLRRRPDIGRIIGGENHRLMEHNTRNMLRFLEGIFARHDPDLFVSTAAWSIQAQMARGFRLEYWSLSFGMLADILQETLSPRSFIEVRPFVTFLARNLRALAQPESAELRRRAAG